MEGISQSGPFNETTWLEIPSVFTAIQEQLGLKFDSGKTQEEVLVIDHVERPAEN